jgi:hypothetical protein
LKPLLDFQVMRELEGTYACEFKREWEEEVESSYRFQSQKVRRHLQRTQQPGLGWCVAW